jgi:hypothetical protein
MFAECGAYIGIALALFAEMSPPRPHYWTGYFSPEEVISIVFRLAGAAFGGAILFASFSGVRNMIKQGLSPTGRGLRR